MQLRLSVCSEVRCSKGPSAVAYISRVGRNLTESLVLWQWGEADFLWMVRIHDLSVHVLAVWDHSSKIKFQNSSHFQRRRDCRTSDIRG